MPFRLATLALALAIAAPVFAQAQKKPAVQEPTTIDAEIIEGVSDIEVTARGNAESPRLRFFDVPIIGAPAASFPLENKRRTGLLAPYYSQSSQRGFEVAVPYYWNIAPEYDDTITPVYMTKRGTQLKNQFRYL